MENILYIQMEGTWYPEACSYLDLKHLLHSPYKKSIVERTIEYLKDKTEAFDDCYPCMKAGSCDLRHVHKWLILFVFMYNSVVKSTTKFDDLRKWKYL
jgi:putative transposase